jgi:hypothetical protein
MDRIELRHKVRPSGVVERSNESSNVDLRELLRHPLIIAGRAPRQRLGRHIGNR